MQKYLIGSCLLGLKNNHDCDYIVVVDGDASLYEQQQFANEKDTYIRSKENIDSTMLFRLPFENENARKYIVNYQLDKDIIGQDFPYEYHVLDRREDYIRLLNWIVDNKALNFVKDNGLNHGNCSKIIYHVAYTVFILENNSTALTTEQKEIVQKIHDKQMPNAYLDVLAEKIKNLKLSKESCTFETALNN